MAITIASPKDVQALSIYLETMNTNIERHIGFCGEAREEIYDSLVNDFSDLPLAQSFLAAYEGSDIIGAIGMDVDLEGSSADVWGPYTKKGQEQLAQQLWEQLLEQLPNKVNKFSFFINQKNESAKAFALQNGAKYAGEDRVLRLTKGDFADKSSAASEPISKAQTESFSRLHDEVFANTYFDAQTILSRLNGDNHLLAVLEADRVAGYVYVEANPEHREGNIEYVAVSPEFTGRGIGTALIRDAAKKLFAYNEIDEITICVGADNAAAVHVYKSAGFSEKYALDSYRLLIKK